MGIVTDVMKNVISRCIFIYIQAKGGGGRCCITFSSPFQIVTLVAVNLRHVSSDNNNGIASLILSVLSLGLSLRMISIIYGRSAMTARTSTWFASASSRPLLSPTSPRGKILHESSSLGSFYCQVAIIQNSLSYTKVIIVFF